MTSGDSRVSCPLIFSSLEVSLATTLVVVASEEGACDTVVVVDVDVDVVEAAPWTWCVVVEVSTGGRASVVVVLVVVLVEVLVEVLVGVVLVVVGE